MVVAAGVYILELPSFMVMAFGVGTFEEKALDFVGGVERVAFLLVQAFGVAFQDSANVAAVGRTVFVDDLAENEDFAVAENVGGRPVEGSPIHAQAKIAFPLGGKTADG